MTYKCAYTGCEKEATEHYVTEGPQTTKCRAHYCKEHKPVSKMPIGRWDSKCVSLPFGKILK